MEAEVFDRNSANQMLLNDALKHFLSAGMVPNLVWPDDRDGPRFADLQAVGFSALHAPVAGNAELPHPLFQIGPSLLARFAGAALLLFR